MNRQFANNSYGEMSEYSTAETAQLTAAEYAATSTSMEAVGTSSTKTENYGGSASASNVSRDCFQQQEDEERPQRPVSRISESEFVVVEKEDVKDFAKDENDVKIEEVKIEEVKIMQVEVDNVEKDDKDCDVEANVDKENDKNVSEDSTNVITEEVKESVEDKETDQDAESEKVLPTEILANTENDNGTDDNPIDENEDDLPLLESVENVVNMDKRNNYKNDKELIDDIQNTIDRAQDWITKTTAQIHRNNEDKEKQETFEKEEDKKDTLKLDNEVQSAKVTECIDQSQDQDQKNATITEVANKDEKVANSSLVQYNAPIPISRPSSASKKKYPKNLEPNVKKFMEWEDNCLEEFYEQRGWNANVSKFKLDFSDQSDDVKVEAIDTNDKKLHNVPEEEHDDDDDDESLMYPERQKADMISIETCMDNLRSSSVTPNRSTRTCSTSIVTERQYVEKFATSQGTSTADLLPPAASPTPNPETEKPPPKKEAIPSRRGLQMLLQEVEANAKRFEPEPDDDANRDKKPRNPLPWENSMVKVSSK